MREEQPQQAKKLACCSQGPYGVRGYPFGRSCCTSTSAVSKEPSNSISLHRVRCRALLLCAKRGLSWVVFSLWVGGWKRDGWRAGYTPTLSYMLPPSAPPGGYTSFVGDLKFTTVDHIRSLKLGDQSCQPVDPAVRSDSSRACSRCVQPELCGFTEKRAQLVLLE